MLILPSEVFVYLSSGAAYASLAIAASTGHKKIENNVVNDCTINKGPGTGAGWRIVVPNLGTLTMRTTEFDELVAAVDMSKGVIKTPLRFYLKNGVTVLLPFDHKPASGKILAINTEHVCPPSVEMKPGDVYISDKHDIRVYKGKYAVAQLSVNVPTSSVHPIGSYAISELFDYDSQMGGRFVYGGGGEIPLGTYIGEIPGLVNPVKREIDHFADVFYKDKEATNLLPFIDSFQVSLSDQSPGASKTVITEASDLVAKERYLQYDFKFALRKPSGNKSLIFETAGLKKFI